MTISASQAIIGDRLPDGRTIEDIYTFGGEDHRPDVERDPLPHLVELSILDAAGKRTTRMLSPDETLQVLR